MSKRENNTNLTLLADYPSRLRLKVVWGQMDAFGHVNNTVYFRYFESARIQYFDDLKLNKFMTKGGIGPILANTSCQFKQPLVFPDDIWVGTKTLSMGKSSLVMEHIIVSDKLGEVASGQAVAVMVDYTKGHKTAIPMELRKAVEAYENMSFDTIPKSDG